jgi:hypothetical protein
MTKPAPVCPTCGQPMKPRGIPDAPAKPKPVAPVKEYAIERKFGVKRMNGGFA